MVCPNCDQPVQAGDSFCAHCGARVEAPPPQSIPVPLNYSAPEEPTPRDEARDNVSYSIVGTPLHGTETEDEPEPKPKPVRPPGPRRSGMSVLLMILIGLFVLGIVVAIWIMHSSLPGTAAASSAGAVTITVTPPTAQVAAGNALDFSAKVTGADNGDVLWRVEEGEAGGRVVRRGAQAAGGNVAVLSVYIAPSRAGTYHLVATSAADHKKSATAEITVVAK
jgi:hypothetical protein